MAISSPENSWGERTSTSLVLWPSVPSTSSRTARIESSGACALNCWAS
jgi:hypothetical protein